MAMEKSCILVALCSFFFFFFLFFWGSLSCPEHQKQALLQLKSSILAIAPSLYNSYSLHSWVLSSSNCCGWDLVECSSIDHAPNNSTSRFVVLLDLMDLLGYLSPQPRVESSMLAPLFHIRSLKELYILGINMQGEIPGVGFSNLINLVHLDMSGNNFNGSIPPQLFHLPLLQSLLLDGNSLSGEIRPDEEEEEIRKCTRGSQELSLLGNKFSDAMLRSVVLCLKGLEY